MSDEQPGPPSEDERERVSMEWLRVSQLRFVEGYRARMAEPHPMRKNARGATLNQRERAWRFGEEIADFRCPPDLPGHEAERWRAGFLHADNICAERGTFAMERADPSRPPPRRKRVALATQEDGLAELAPPMSRQEAREFWERHRDVHTGYVDAGEQK